METHNYYPSIRVSNLIISIHLKIYNFLFTSFELDLNRDSKLRKGVIERGEKNN